MRLFDLGFWGFIQLSGFPYACKKKTNARINAISLLLGDQGPRLSARWDDVIVCVVLVW